MFEKYIDFWIRARYGTLTLNDESLALTSISSAYRFAELNISGSNIKALQEVVFREPEFAYCFAKYIPGADIDYCRYHCKNNAMVLEKFDQMIVDKIKSVLI